jgi:tetratricopeptide (TPR) repeat protein
MIEESLALSEEIESSENKEYIWSLSFLGDAAFQMNDLEAARASYERCVNDLREIRDRNFLAYAVRRLGQLEWREGSHDQARLLCEESLSINRELGDERGTVASLAACAGLATAQGKFGPAAQLLGAVHALLEAKRIRLVHMDRLEYDRNVSIVRKELSPVSFDKAWGKGGGMSLENTVAFAMGGR